MADPGVTPIGGEFVLKVENIDKVALNSGYELDMISFSVKKVTRSGPLKKYHDYPFIMKQTSDLTEKGVSIQYYGSVYTQPTETLVLNVETRGGQRFHYHSEEIDVSTCKVGDEYELTLDL